MKYILILFVLFAGCTPNLLKVKLQYRQCYIRQLFYSEDDMYYSKNVTEKIGVWCNSCNTENSGWTFTYTGRGETGVIEELKEENKECFVEPINARSRSGTIRLTCEREKLMKCFTCKEPDILITYTNGKETRKVNR